MTGQTYRYYTQIGFELVFDCSNECNIHTDSTDDYYERTRITVKNLETTEL